MCLHDQTIRFLLVKSIKYCQLNKGLELYAYCIMPGQVHLIAKATGEYTLSEILRDFKKYTSKKIVEQVQEEPESRREWLLLFFSNEADRIKRNFNFKVWQDGNQPKEIYSNKFFYEKINYIHQNPVQDLIVEKPEDYLFSSARNYAGLDAYLDIVLETKQLVTYG